MIYFYFIVVVGIGAFLQTTIGFGFPVFTMVFMPLLFPYNTAVALNQITALANCIYLAIRYCKKIKWKVLLPLLIPTLLVGVFFTYFSFSIDVSIIRLLLGMLLVSIAVYMYRFSDKIHIKSTPKNGIIAGVIAGVGNGLFSIGGPPSALYLLAAIPDDKEAFVGTMQVYFVICNVFNIIIRVLNGAFSSTGAFAEICMGWCAVLLGTGLGTLAFRRISNSSLKKFVYAFIGVNGLFIIFQYFFL